MKRVFVLVLSLAVFLQINAQRQAEKLDRGLVAVKVDNGVYLSWRVTGFEWMDVGYNVYRNGVKVNQDPLTETSNYVDNGGSVSDQYSISAVIGGVEQERSPDAPVHPNQYFDIPLNRPAGGTVPDGSYDYSPNDGSVGDLDGDGDMDIVLKWDPSNSHDNAHDGYTGNVIIDAYTLDGDHLWRIDLGRNIRAGAHYTQFLVADFDGDGKAELVCKTADGTVDGLGNVIGNESADYRNSTGRILTGPEFLTVFNGETGAAMQTINFEPARGSVGIWGDTYGNRVDRFLACAPYLDGEHPSIVMCRGYYERTMLAAYDWKNGELTMRWLFNSEAGGLLAYSGQGNHNLSVADVDNDGKDEIIYGSMTIDDDGTGLYSTGLYHGDALHVSDMDPDHPGLEVFAPHESGGNGVTFREAATGKILWQHRKNEDVGRGIAANIQSNNRGFECWATSGLGMYNDKGDYIGIVPNSVNFAIWWDGDLYRELLDKTSIRKVSTTIFSGTGVVSNNGTKSTPVLSADLFGDWREEVIWRYSDNERLRVFFTNNYTDYRIYSLLHDPQYRNAIAWQNVGYNQPPHAGFYFEPDMALPIPLVFSGKKWQGNVGLNNWDLTSANFTNKAGDVLSFNNGDTVIFSFNGFNTEPVSLTEDLAPGLVVFASPDDYTLEGDGSLTGNMNLYKSQRGSLTLQGNHDFSGKTIVSDGALIVNGTLTNSKVLVSGGIWGGKNSTPDKGGRLGGNGHLNGGVVVQNRGALLPGMMDADTLFIENGLEIHKYAVCYFDLSGSGNGLNDIVMIDGDLTLEEGIEVVVNLLDGEINNEDYVLFSYSGTLTGSTENINITGLEGFFYTLLAENGQIIIRRPVTRDPATLTWTGAESSIWDLGGSINWTLNETGVFFLPQDSVIIDDVGSASPEINVTGIINIGNLNFNASSDYTITGEGTIVGDGGILKKGAGSLEILTSNIFSGGTVIEEGSLVIDKLNNGESPSGLGAAGSEPSSLTLNGGELKISGTASSDKGIMVGPGGGTLNITGNQGLDGLITGSGNLEKKGNGTLSIFRANDLTGNFIIDGGMVQLLSDEANSGGLGTGLVIMKSGTLSQFDTRNSYNASNMNILVPENGEGTYILDGRIYCRDNLTGSGILNIRVNFVRSDFEGDWSEFNGIINVSADNDGGDFRVSNSYGYSGCEINLNNYVYAYHLSDDTISVGSLNSVNGSTMRGAIWKIGSLNKEMTLEGKIEGNMLIKTGTGRLIISGNSNNYSGGTIIKNGSLWVKNISGSATGTGPVLVMDKGVLGGDGIISGSVEIEGGGYLSPGDNIGTLQLGETLVMNENSILNMEVSNAESTADMLSAGDISLNSAILFLLNVSSVPYKNGDQFKILNFGSIQGSFAAIYPKKPADGLTWNTDKLYTEGIISISVEQNTGIENTLADLISVFPNPTRGKLFIDLTAVSENIINLTILGSNGTVVANLEPDTTTRFLNLDLAGYPEGIYIIRVFTDNKILTEKVFLIE